MESLLQWDVMLFRLINEANSPLWDEVMFLLSTKWFWIPAYAFVLFCLFKKFKARTVGIYLIGVTLLILSTDQLTSSVLKPTVKRYRPCQVEAGLAFDVHRVHNKCGGKYGFASSHAANFFGLATFLALIFRNSWWSLGLFSCASLVAFSRIYLGVHFPLDVIAGAAIGLFFGWLWAKISQIFG